MKHSTILSILFFSISLQIHAQTACDCSVALRYDIYRSNKDYYSEMSLAKEINQENYKQIQQKAGGSLSIFGIKIGANGENIEQVKAVYREKLVTNNIVHDIENYERISTSANSYDAYTTCLKICYDDQKPNIYPIVLDNTNEKNVLLNIHYTGVPRSKPILVSYTIGKTKKTVSIRLGEDKLVTIPRITKKAFTVWFETGIFKPQKADITIYKPVTAVMKVEYRNVRRIDSALAPLVLTTKGNPNGEKPSGISQIKEYLSNTTAERNNRPNYPSYADGAYESNILLSQQSFLATVTVFKRTPPAGYKFSSNILSCEKIGCDACNGWTEEKIKFRDDETMFLYSEKRYSCSVKLTLNSTVYRVAEKDETAYAFTTGRYITFQLPKTAQNQILLWEETVRLPLEQSNEFLLFKGRTESQNDYIYTYEIRKFLD